MWRDYKSNSRSHSVTTSPARFIRRLVVVFVFLEELAKFLEFVKTEEARAMGLSADQKKLLTSSWKTLGANADTMQTNGALLFGLLFKTFPDTRTHFPHFKGMADDGLKSTGVGRAHAMAVFTGLGAFIDTLSDDECVNGLAVKLGRNHVARKVGPARFQQMREVFGPFLEKTLGGGASADMKGAWDALLASLQDTLAAEEKKG
ncbi:globin-like [Babylonia areolata]|uniref:globin-like n=1 Tax=Babylonia areolata TaxID=304850 RepID=UPI003FD27A32